MRILFLFAASICYGLSSAAPDDEPLPPGTKFHIDSISWRVDEIRSHFDAVNISSAPANTAVAVVAPVAQQRISGGETGIITTETDQTIVVDVSADVLFDFDRADLQVGATESLQTLTTLIASRAKHGVSIDGFTDSKGSASYNQKLSVARAESVRHWLIEKGGLSTIAFSVKGYGAENPVAPNTTADGQDNPAGRQKNRRVEITIKK